MSTLICTRLFSLLKIKIEAEILLGPFFSTSAHCSQYKPQTTPHRRQKQVSSEARWCAHDRDVTNQMEFGIRGHSYFHILSLSIQLPRGWMPGKHPVKSTCMMCAGDLGTNTCFSVCALNSFSFVAFYSLFSQFKILLEKDPEHFFLCIQVCSRCRFAQGHADSCWCVSIMCMRFLNYEYYKSF